MKFKGFANSLFNFGGLDLKLASEQKRLGLLSCVACGFATKDMVYCNCDHVYCESCLLQFHGPVDTAQPSDVLQGHCILCLHSVTALRITIHEEFIAELECRCPRCHEAVTLRDMKEHLQRCMFSAYPAQVSNESDVEGTEELASSTVQSDHKENVNPAPTHARLPIFARFATEPGAPFGPLAGSACASGMPANAPPGLARLWASAVGSDNNDYMKRNSDEPNSRPFTPRTARFHRPMNSRRMNIVGSAPHEMLGNLGVPDRSAFVFHTDPVVPDGYAHSRY